MPTNKYKLTFPNLTGCINAVYRDGVLCAFDCSLKSKRKPLPAERVKGLLSWMPVTEDDLKQQTQATVQPVGFDDEQKRQASSKVAAWMAAYKQAFGLRYKLAGKETALLNACQDVTEARVSAYLKCSKWWADRNTISQFVNVQNELDQHIAQGGEERPKNPFPDSYDRDYEKSLSPQQMTKYWAHLRALGWKADRRGSQTRWIPPKATGPQKIAQDLTDKFKAS